jgi:hypothetical protein
VPLSLWLVSKVRAVLWKTVLLDLLLEKLTADTFGRLGTWDLNLGTLHLKSPSFLAAIRTL